MHLAGIGVRECTELEVHDYQGSKAPVEKEQIHSIPSVSNTQSALPTNKSEIAAKFQEKRFQLCDESGFKIGFGVFVLQSKKF
jgi:hypothetical protein